MFVHSKERFSCIISDNRSGPAEIQDVFGIGDGVFWLDEVNCRGNETDISQCAFNEPGVHDCLYFEAVGIVCGKLCCLFGLTLSQTTN